MAPKIGPRGITIQDVQNVATNGLPKQGAATYESAWKPATATTPVDYAALLAGGPAPTYGQKYGGQPSSEYGKQMILGAALQARSVGDLAAMQAANAQAAIDKQYASDLVAGTNKLYPSYQETFKQPLMTRPGTKNYQPSNLDKSAQAIADQERELNSMYVYDFNGTRRLSATADPLKARALQSAINEGKQALNRAGYTPQTAIEGQAEAVRQTAQNKADAYGAYMNRMNMLDTSGLSSTRNTTNEGIDSVSLQPNIPSLLRGGAERQTATNLEPGLRQQINEQVMPYANLSEQILGTPLSQYAQQIAVQRYGYDPALAQGLFGTDVDVQAMKDEANLTAAQNPELSMTPAEAVYQQYGQSGLDAYLAQMAQEALYGTPAQQEAAAKEAEDAANAPVDLELMSAYGVKPAQVSPNDPATARQLMTDPNFFAQFQAGLDAMGQANELASASQLEALFVSNYLKETGDPVTAIMLDTLLKKFTFG